MSPYILECRAEVIIARIVNPARLKSRAESTTAGRDFISLESLKGNGTTTTVHGSQITKVLVVFRRIPFRL
jgi:hypothetical protein